MQPFEAGSTPRLDPRRFQQLAEAHATLGRCEERSRHAEAEVLQTGPRANKVEGDYAAARERIRETFTAARGAAEKADRECDELQAALDGDGEFHSTFSVSNVFIVFNVPRSTFNEGEGA